MEDARIEKLEKMLQVSLEAICSLAKETTGKTMVIGYFDSPDFSFGAGPNPKHVKWGEVE